MPDAPQSIAESVPLPAKEAERLAALRRYQILDTAPEAAFDRITSLAARLFKVPTALVSLVDESRAWFKSSYGFNLPEVPRDDTICSFALLSEEILVIPDARQDRRFTCNPFVECEPGLRFYAGAPLIDRNGFNLGTLCVLDTKPREALTDEQKAILTDLAALVVDELELRLAIAMQIAAEKERQQAVQNLQLYANVVRNAQVGIVVWQVENLNDPGSSRLLIANPAASKVTGFDFESILGKTMAESFPQLVQSTLVQKYLEVVRTERSLDLGEIFYGEDGISPGIYSLKAFPLPDRCWGLAFENVTARKQIETQLQESQHYNQQVAEAVPGVLFVHDLIQQRNVYTNRQISELLGYSSEQVQAMGETAVTTLIHPDDLGRVFAHFEDFRSVAEGEVLGLEYQARHANGELRWIYSQSVVFNRTPEGLPRQILGVSLDISDRKSSEEALRQRETELSLITNAVPVLISYVDAQQRYRFNNRGYEEWFGYSAADIYGKTLWEVLGEAIYEKIRPYVEQVLAGQSVTYETQVPHQKEGIRDVSTTYVPRFNEQGTVEGFVALVSDITERNQTQQELQKTLQTLQTLVAASPLPIIVIEPDATVQLWNPAAEQVFGWSEAEVLGQPLPIVPEEKLEECRQYREKLANGETILGMETYRCRQNGSYLSISLSAAPLYSDRHNIHGILLILQDITERQKIEQALRESEEWARLAIQVAQLGAWRLHLDTQQVEMDERMRQIWGEPDEAIMIPLSLVLERMHPDDRERVAMAVKNALNPKSSGSYEIEYRLAWNDGTERWVLAKGQAQFEGEGESRKAIDFFGTLLEITERKQAERALQEHSERLNLLYETTRELLGAKQPLDLMNRLFRKLSVQMDLDYYYHFQVSQQDGKQRLRLMNYHGLSEEQAKAFESIELGQAICGWVAKERHQIVFNQAEIATHPNAEAIRSMGVSAYAGQPLMVQGRLLGTLSFASLTRTQFTPQEAYLMQAISEQVAIALDRAELVASLQQQAEDLAQANRVKDEFLAVLSHELRSPLNPILGWTQLLQTGKFDAHKTKQALDIIERNAKQQAQLIDDLLDISRILRGKLALNEAPVDLVFTIESALETMRLAVEAKRIGIKTSLNSSLPPVLGDVGRLQQIVLNLLSNAIKFTPSGGQVEVRLDRVGDEAQIQVKDNGKGIAPDFLPYVFDSFRQEDGRTTRKFGGLGLGLAIVRQLSELHGGTVRAESPGEGAGATFTIRLPLLKTQSMSCEDVNPTNQSSGMNVLQGIRILVVDDEADMRDLVVTILEQASAIVEMAASAAEALAIFDRFEPMLLISDIGMPETDGYELMRQVKSRSAHRGKSIPAIALTAYAMEQDQQQAFAAGFLRHVAKPIEPDLLIQEIVALLNN